MARILIVDDEPLNRTLLHAYFEGSGHELSDAESGERAIEIAAAWAPDLVLLDVMMQGINGFETAMRLKEHAGDAFLPIMLLTALSDPQARLLGLRMGADEFLTKPVDRLELEVRVKNLLALRAKDAALRARNLALAEILHFRDEMSQLIVHDLKSPMAAILVNCDYLAGKLGSADEEVVAALGDSQGAARRILRLLANLLDIARLEEKRLALQRSPLELPELVGRIIEQRTMLAEARKIIMRFETVTPTRILGDGELLTRAIENLFDNAIRHTPLRGRIEVSAEREDGFVRLRVGNTGMPIPVEARPAIFEKYASTPAGRMNMGLGLYFCRLVTEAHGGRIWVEETRELPTVFVLQLPV